MSNKISTQAINQIINNIISGYYEGFIHDSGVIFQGGMLNGKADGEGRLILPCGNVYEYEFSQGTFAKGGGGIIIYPDGSFYEGGLTIYEGDSSLMKGEYCPKGRGIRRNPDGSIYRDGYWEGDFDYKTIWLMGYLPWYENGELFHIGEPEAFTIPDVLCPVVCLNAPTRNGNQIFPRVNVMYPHLQNLGCPNSKNHFSRLGFTSDEACVRSFGFDNVQHYFYHHEVHRPKWAKLTKDVLAARTLMSVVGYVLGVYATGSLVFFLH